MLTAALLLVLMLVPQTERCRTVEQPTLARQTCVLRTELPLRPPMGADPLLLRRGPGPRDPACPPRRSLGLNPLAEPRLAADFIFDPLLLYYPHSPVSFDRDWIEQLSGAPPAGPQRETWREGEGLTIVADDWYRQESRSTSSSNDGGSEDQGLPNLKTLIQSNIDYLPFAPGFEFGDDRFAFGFALQIPPSRLLRTALTNEDVMVISGLRWRF